MDTKIQISSAYMNYNKAKNLLQKSLLYMLEDEVNKDEKSIDTKRIRNGVLTLDVLNGNSNIPDEFSVDNFTKRFNDLHNMNLTTSNLQE